MPENIFKKTYYLPIILTKSLAEWCKPGRDYSEKVAGAILILLALADEIPYKQLCKLAYSDDIEKAKKETKKIISDELLNNEMHAYLDALSPDQKKIVFLTIKETERKIGQKK